ncbi:MAG: 3-deoxy-manno-octulosonate cytidylyltransferase [Deltaproteobacteria bacterium]|nr:3-deoxy-manno-octulosonate cytidylyltransferase [Deltaproteobacteria bacterium]
MKTIAFIPSRYDSTRFPGKPLALISGKPMIQHVYRCATSCPDVSEVFVATDDERIFQCVHDFGGKAIMTERKHPSGTDRIAEAVQKIGLSEDDLIVNIQGDQPVFHPEIISRMIDPLKQDSDIPMGTVQFRITDQAEVENGNIVKVVTDNEGFALYFSRSPIPLFRDSESDRVCYKHLGFYVYRKDFILQFSRLPGGKLEAAEKLEQLRALEHGFRIRVVEVAHDSTEVDAPEDIRKIEELEAGQ